MKWLASFLCLLTINLAVAQAQAQEQSVALPLITFCAPGQPNEEKLQKEHGEIAFLEGDAKVFAPGQQIVGTVKIFLNPLDEKNFTILIEIPNEIHCLVIIGDNMRPIISGDPL